MQGKAGFVFWCGCFKDYGHGFREGGMKGVIGGLGCKFISRYSGTAVRFCNGRLGGQGAKTSLVLLDARVGHEVS